MNNLLLLFKTMSPLITKGLGGTLLIWLGAAFISYSIGVPLGIMNSKKLSARYLRTVISTYIFFVRSIPVYVHALLAYFVVPEIIGISFSPAVAAIIALGICSSGYSAEIIRSGINSLDKGQWDAAFALGYTRLQTVRAIILPQLMRQALPAIFNELESLIKSTSIFSAIGVIEMTKVGTNIVARTMNPIPIYISLAIIYILLSGLLKVAYRYTERRFCYA